MANDTQHHLGAASLAIGAPAISTGSEAKPVRQRQRKPSVALMTARSVDDPFFANANGDASGGAENQSSVGSLGLHGRQDGERD
jgi:hypothetical protein